jgi:hypothetical protein
MLEGCFFTLAVFLSLLSFGALWCLDRAIFTPSNILVVAGGAGIAAVLLTWGCRRTFRCNRLELSILGIALLALLLRLNVSPYVYGGQDPGVYFNVASYFAHNGTAVIKDELLPELLDNPELRQYYVERSIRHVNKLPDGTWYGNLVAGTYLRDFDKNEWLPQFYFLNPVWLAIGQWLFGVEWQGLVIAVFSTLTVIGGALVTWRLSRSNGATLLAAALLATNPTLSYFGTAPVSEGLAGFFFMAALALLVGQRGYLSILPLGGLFLTRITGFITLPLLLVALLWIVMKRRDRSAIAVGLGFIVVYALSVTWGLTYSPHYATGIYTGKLGITPAMLAQREYFFLALGLIWGLGGVLLLTIPSLARVAARWGLRWGVRVTLLLVGALIASALYRGYLLGFTDAYVGHRWFDARWQMVGLGFGSLGFLSLHTLAVMLSYGGAIAFLLALPVVGRIGLQRAVVAPVAVLAAGFLGVFSLYPLATPYLYYFGRYLASELLPLGIICGAVAVDLFAKRYVGRATLIRWGYFLIVSISLLPSAVTRLSLREGLEFYNFVACLDRMAVGRSIFFIEKRGVPETPLVTPLRFTYRRATFAFHYKDFPTPASRQALYDYFHRKGYRIFLLTAQERWRGLKEVEFVGRFSAPFRTIGGKRSQPRRISTRRHTMMLFAVGGKVDIPAECTVTLK